MIKHIPNITGEIPMIYEQQQQNTQFIYAKYYIPNSDEVWNIMEYSKLQRLFWGYLEPENIVKYFTLEDLIQIADEYDVDIELNFLLTPEQLIYIP